jgi:uncharacterized protein YegP (UPF0339 family)
MTRIDQLHRKWLKDPAYKAAYDELADEFAEAAATIGQKGRPARRPLRFVIFRQESGAFGWRMISAAGVVVTESPADFASREAARKAITQFKLRTSRAPVTDAVA